MPSTVKSLFESQAPSRMPPVKWGERVPTGSSGVYIVSLSSNAGKVENILESAPIDIAAVDTWINRVPAMSLDGNTRPQSAVLAKRLSEFWLPDENILYIGKASNLRKRVGSYYRTPLGDRRPHAGGHWIKTLSVLAHTYVHFAETSSPEEVEAGLLAAFVSNVSYQTRSALWDPDRPFPFANLEYPRGNRKNHGITKAKL